MGLYLFEVQNNNYYNDPTHVSEASNITSATQACVGYKQTTSYMCCILYSVFIGISIVHALYTSLLLKKCTYCAYEKVLLTIQ